MLKEIIIAVSSMYLIAVLLIVLWIAWTVWREAINESKSP